MGLMDRIKEMFGGEHGEHGEKAGQRPDAARPQEPGRDTPQYQSGQPGDYSADADAFGNVTGKTAQVEDEQVEQAKSDMTEEGGHEWEK
ncbi:MULTISPECIES: hypothetical protein [Kitasatospora]|uniref:hypothetical protein n=1 Tax=Kitasatospora TaxID=2063 RepID=UPI000C70AF41|nr:hypothetical protein [Kitasatospora sp. GP30]MDH6142596.1 hypothetical protein [Kitasatospora sp. GP30]